MKSIYQKMNDVNNLEQPNDTTAAAVKVPPTAPTSPTTSIATPRVQRVEATRRISNHDFLLSLSEANAGSRGHHRKSPNDLINSTNTGTSKLDGTSNHRTSKEHGKKEISLINSNDEKSMSHNHHNREHRRNNTFLLQKAIQDEKEVKDMVVMKVSSEDAIDDNIQFENIPTLLDNNMVMDDNMQHEYENYTEEQELPSLKQLESKMNYVVERSRDGANIDFSILTKHLIPKDEVVGETDQIWTKDFLMHEVTKYFNE